jgi:hypothetical protein
VGGGDNQLAKIELGQLLPDCFAQRQQEAGVDDARVDADDDRRIERPVAFARLQCQDVGSKGILNPVDTRAENEP